MSKPGDLAIKIEPVIHLGVIVNYKWQVEQYETVRTGGFWTSIMLKDLDTNVVSPDSYERVEGFADTKEEAEIAATEAAKDFHSRMKKLRQEKEEAQNLKETHSVFKVLKLD